MCDEGVSEAPLCFEGDMAEGLFGIATRKDEFDRDISATGGAGFFLPFSPGIKVLGLCR